LHYHFWAPSAFDAVRTPPLLRPQSDALVAGTPHWREAGEGLGAVAQVFLDHPQLLLPTLYAPMSHRLPAQAVYGIPNPASLKVGTNELLTLDCSHVSRVSFAMPCASGGTSRLP